MKLNYRIFNKDKNKTLIFVHGLLANSSNFIGITNQFENFRIIVPDLRNHGDSDHSESHTYDDLSNDLAEFIKDHDINPIAIIGHSMGGKAVMKLFENHFDLVQSTTPIIEDIFPVSYSDSLVKKIIKFMDEIPLSKIFNREEIKQVFIGEFKDVTLVEFVLKNLTYSENQFIWKSGIKNLRKNLENILENPYISANNIKIHFIFGSDSPYYSADIENKTKMIYTNANFYKITGSGHWVHFSKPVEFSQTIRNILK